MPPIKPKAAVIIATPGAESSPDESDKGDIIVPMPQGMDTEGKKPGDTLDAVCEFEIEDGGKLCLKKINGLPVDGAAEEDGEDQAPPDSSFAGAVSGQSSEDA